MLILSRHVNEKVVVGNPPNQITVMVVDIRGDKVRLGFDAPADVPVHRGEVRAAIDRGELQNLGWANSWLETPGTVERCRAAGHQVSSENADPTNHGYCTVVKCEQCRYSYRVDSSD